MYVCIVDCVAVLEGTGKLAQEAAPEQGINNCVSFCFKEKEEKRLKETSQNEDVSNEDSTCTLAVPPIHQVRRKVVLLPSFT